MKLFLVKFTVSSSTYMNDDEHDDEYTRMVEAVDEDHAKRIIENQPEFKTDEYSVYRRVYFDEITTVLRDSSNSSPDELPADMEALVHALDAVEKIGAAEENFIRASLLFDAVNRSRALLLAYQERGRALERIAYPEHGIGLHRLRGIAHATLKGKSHD